MYLLSRFLSSLLVLLHLRHFVLSFFLSFFFFLLLFFYYIFFVSVIFAKKAFVDVQNAISDGFIYKTGQRFIAMLVSYSMRRNMKEHTLLKIEMQCKKGAKSRLASRQVSPFDRFVYFFLYFFLFFLCFFLYPEVGRILPLV